MLNFDLTKVKAILVAVFLLHLLVNSALQAQWTKINTPTGGLINCFGVSQTNIFVGVSQGGLYVSSVFNTSWAPVETGSSNISSMLVLAGTHIYASSEKGMLRSTDSGNSWALVSVSPQSARTIAVSGAYIFAGGDTGIFRSTDDGLTWNAVTTGLTNLNVSSIAVHGQNVIVGTYGGGMFVSYNNGNSWEPFSGTGITSNYILSLAVYNNAILAGTSNGLYISEDSGGTWTLTTAPYQISKIAISGTEIYAGTPFNGMLRSTNGGTNWTATNYPNTSHVIDIFFSGIQIYAGGTGGVFLSQDSGASWQKVNTNIASTNIKALGRVGTRIYACSQGDGMFVSSDEGDTWTSISTGLSDYWVYSFAAIGDKIFIGTNTSGVYVSYNNGLNWQNVTNNLPALGVYSLAVIGSDLYAATNIGVYKSSNNGASWEEKNNGLSSINVSCLAVNGSQLYAGTFNNGIYVSTNSGDSWTQINSGLTTSRINNIAVIGTDLFAGTEGGGVFISKNGGANWSASNSGFGSYQNVYSFAEYGGNIFCATNGGVLRSTNGGSSWISTGMPTSMMGQTFCMTATNIMVGTFYQGIWRKKLSDFVGGTFVLTAPVGGETWQAGTIHNITWTSNTVTNVKIEYSTNNGTSWSNIISSTSALPGYYSWPIPNTPSVQCFVRISDANDPLLNRTSANAFTITSLPSASISITSPNGGENLQIGTQYNIRWTSSNVSNVKLEYSTNNGINWIEIIASTPASTGAYSWTVPNTISNQCKVRIYDVSNLSVSSTSASIFSITTQSVGIIALSIPIGGENWQIGTQKIITWTSSNVTNVKLEYSANNGTSWTEIIASTPASAGTYIWNVPNAASSECRIRISDAGNSLVYSTSPGNFTIFSYPSSITLSSQLTFTNAESQSSYRIVGVPGESGYSISSIMSGASKTDWNAYWDNGATSDYQKEYNGTSTFNFVPGNAFWVISRNQINISRTANAVTLASDRTYSIPLHAGWNLISNPFAINVAWSGVSALNSLTQPIWEYTGSFSQAATFEPYKGYYYYNSTGLSSIKIPYQSGLGKIVNAPRDGIRLELKENGRTVDEVGIKFSIESSRDLDEKDIYSPGSSYSEVSMDILHPEGNARENMLKEDARPSAEEGHEYLIKIKNSREKNLVLALTVNSDGLPVYLADDELRKIEKMEPGKNISAAKKDKIYRLIVGKSDYIKKLSEEYTPKEYALFQNYPNPFNPTTIIRYQIARPGNVLLVLYDQLGREVMVLVKGHHTAGNYGYELSAGRLRLSSGIYFYSLFTEDVVLTKKMMLIK